MSSTEVLYIRIPRSLKTEIAKRAAAEGRPIYVEAAELLKAAIEAANNPKRKRVKQ